MPAYSGYAGLLIHTTSVCSCWGNQMEERQVKIFKNLLRDESGQDLIEYALVAALIALGAIVSMKALAGGIRAVPG
jgi:Flp pilus assembly pilin Flp